jgi:GTP-binding protein
MEVRFIKSSNDLKTCPKSGIPEFAFIGRSNVGKSSLINMVSGVKDLAKISSKPGKTKLINHFLVLPFSHPDKKKLHKKDIKPFVPDANSWYLVDLPGYGYARASKSDKEHFSELIKSYIFKRPTLLCLFVLIDSRLEPQKIDVEFLTLLGHFQVPFVLIFTKTDKISAILKKPCLTIGKKCRKYFLPQQLKKRVERNCWILLKTQLNLKKKV